MKPQLLKISNNGMSSFNVRQDKLPYFLKSWHYHEELELIRIDKGSGAQFIGDSVSRFSDGDIYLIGANLPHCWRCDDIYHENRVDLNAEAKVVHFQEDFLGEEFLQLPENRSIKELFALARNGIKICGQANKEVSELLEHLVVAAQTEKIILILQLLNTIALSNDLETLSSPGFQPEADDNEKERLNDIYDYTLRNFRKKISLEEISDIGNISANSFCRYFKNRTKKTYSRFLLEVRVGHACKLLIENKNNVNFICYESGFNNFSNFNKYFKAITGKSPLLYKKTFNAEFS